MVLSSPVVSFDEARRLAAEHGTPLLVCNIERIKDNYRRLQASLNAEIFYAVKANPLPKILKTLVSLDSGFDVASVNEMKACLAVGAKPVKLLYANPVKPAESIRFAYEHKIRTFTYDSIYEVKKMAENAPGSEVILRLAVKDVGSVCKFSAKFGAAEKYSIELLEAARDAGLKPIGLSFHVGSQCTRIENFISALDMCASIAKKAEKKGIHLSVLDIGGGIPIRYTSEVYSLEELSKTIHTKIQNTVLSGMRIIMEPGRPMVANAMTLIAKVIGVNRRRGKECIYIDDGCYNSLSEKVFGHCEYEVITDKEGEKEQQVVFGPTCDSVDVVTRKAMLPRMEEGDIVKIPNTGAYSNAAATHFNGFSPAKIIFSNN
jgi:ornithine decarboxylase